MLFRRLAFAALWSLLCLPTVSAAAGNLAMAPAAYPETMPGQQQALRVDRVVVHKAKRRLDLMADGQPVHSYRISLGDNPEGHKLFEGDERTPEGEYTLDWRNPGSQYYKSIHISYPNDRDRELASAWGLDPGGQIMIHGLPNDVGDMAFAYAGLDWTDGCIAVSNEAMDQIWKLVPDGTPIRILP
ncbi:L,D-transpeptidase family protein [Marinobacter sp. JSM 1782161]|uniref:L,D-transpeptidase family protein n=1 Tax=Marinobacter sp. JSM 1782161 TaxID=2685906 RepID=UPI001401D824